MRVQTYSFQSLGEILGVSAVSIGRWADEGKIPTITIGRRRLVPRSYVAELFEKSGYPLLEHEAQENESA